MLPYQHAGASLAVSIVYVSGHALILGKMQSIMENVSIILIATLLDVVIDIDHVLWSLALNPKLALKYILRMNYLGLYRQLISPSGYFYQRIIALDKRYSKIFFVLHGIWNCLVGFLIYLLLHDVAPFSSFIPLFWTVLAVHYISDLIYWR